MGNPIFLASQQDESSDVSLFVPHEPDKMFANTDNPKNLTRRSQIKACLSTCLSTEDIKREAPPTSFSSMSLVK
jgi:hypothetical protein